MNKPSDTDNAQTKNPPDAKDLPNANGQFTEDKRKEVRQEHTNHFTNREGHPVKK